MPFIPLDQAEGEQRLGFVPLDGGDGAGFVPLEPERPSTLKTVALNNPLTAIGETALSLGSQAVALPVAGLVGLGEAAGKALGLHDRDPAGAVEHMAQSMTYEPRGEMGKAATAAMMYPFEKLAEGAGYVGTKVLNATGSPELATAIDTAIQAAPMAVAPAWKAGKATTARGLLNLHSNPSPELLTRLLRVPEDEAAAYFNAWQAEKTAKGTSDGAAPVPPVPGRVPGMDADPAAMPEPQTAGLEALRRPGDQTLPAMDGELQQLPDGRWAETPSKALAGQAGREWPLRADELPMAGAEVSSRQPAHLPQAELPRPDVEHRGGGAAAGDLPEHLQASAAEAGDASGPGVFVADDAARWPDLADLSGTDAEHRSLGAGGGNQAGDASGQAVPLWVPDGARPDPRQIAEESLARAERILSDTGSIAGFIDHYNLHVADGKTIESFSRNADGDYSFRISDSGRAGTLTMAPEQVPAWLDVLRSPERVAELEARNSNDVVLGRRVRDLDDLTLSRWAGMVSLAPEARGKVAREIKRRNAEVVSRLPVTSEVTAETPVRREAVRSEVRTELPVSERAVSTAVSTETAPLAMRVDAAAHEAATSPFNSKPQPTPAQIEAGTYPKGHVDLHGLQIAIENPKGSIRSGVDAAGRPWQTEMAHHYGYLKRTLARDGDQVDVFVGDHPSSTRAFVIDQIDPKTGKYDEPKVILGALDEAEARATYAANYEPGWKGLGAVTPMEMDAFKAWLKSDATKKPVGLARVAGKAVTEFDDAALARLSVSPTLSETARAKLQAEIERRAGGAEDSQVQARRGPSNAQPMAAGVQNGTWNPGANYSPFVDQVRPPATGAKTLADLPAPKRRERIIKDLADALGAHVYEGRVKGKNRLGFFRPRIEEVRTKRAADIEVAAHELAHLIDSRVPELHQAWKADKELAAELKSVSYDQKSVKEGFAEAVRLWMTQPETLEAKAPKAHAWLESFAGSHEYGPALRTAQERMTAWFGQDALNRARSKIGAEKPLAEYLDRFWDKFRQSTVDDLHGVYRMEMDLTGKINPAGPYESARLSRASASIADGAVRFGYPVKQADGSFKFAGKGLDDILKPVSKNLDETLLYFVGRSARELIGQGREHLFTAGEIDAMLRLRTPERDKAFAEYQEWNRGILDFAEAQGIINPEARRLWQRTQYLPFHRVDQPGGIKGKPGDWAGVQALTGGTTNIKDVLGNMIGNAAMLIDKAVKNEARRKIANLSQMDGGGRFMVKIDTEARPVKISGDQVLEAMLKRYGIAIDGDAPAFFEFLIKGQPPAGNNVVAVLQGGKPVWFEAGDPVLYRALKAIDRPVQSDVVRWLSLPKRIGQATITATPDFWMANIARDTLMGSVMTRAGFRPIIDSLQGMRLRLTSDPLYRDYLANGGGLSSIFLDEHHLRTKLERFYRDQGIDYRTVLDAPDKILTFMETLGDAFEMSTRLGEYRRAIQAGKHPRHAAYLGRDVSTDFAMRGDSKALGFMYDTVMFLKPAVVSWDRLYRGIAHDPNKGAIAVKAGAMALASAALYLLNRNDPRYADLPDWDRDANWHFFIGDQHFRWPKIWEIGALASAAERSAEKIMAEDPEGLGKDFARILGATFNLNLMPQIAAPLYEQATNRNSFTKAPIETPGMENVQPFLRAKPGTSETMKALGMATRNLPEAMQVNPARAEALLRGYFNTYALYGLMLTDQALFGDKLPAKRTDELPVIRRFYSQEPPRHTKFEAEFYDLLGEAKRLRGTMRELDEMGLRTIADQKERSPLAGEAKPLERAAKNLSAINRDMEAVRRDANLSPAEKRNRLDQLTRERNGLLKEAVTDSKAARKPIRGE